jgi:broad specificity phosphatase PhoE
MIHEHGVLQVQSAATRLWKRIAGEQDDYIANPKVRCIARAQMQAAL